jgi:hypothetical protein
MFKVRARNGLPPLTAMARASSGTPGSDCAANFCKTAAMGQPSCCFMIPHDIGEILAQQ